MKAKEAHLYEQAYVNEYGEPSSSTDGTHMLHTVDEATEDSSVVSGNTNNTKSTKDLTPYDHMMIRRKLALEKINSRKKQLEDMESKNCTFQPTLIARNKSKLSGAANNS